MKLIFRVILVFLLGVSLGLGLNGHHLKKVLGDTAEFSPICKAESLIRVMENGSRNVMAERVNGVLIPEEKYRDRLKTSNSGVVLNDLIYNDNGNYEFSCGPQKIEPVTLEVHSPSNFNLSVSEGDRVTLPCFAVTVDGQVKSVKWSRKDALVFKQTPSGETERGAGFEGRASIQNPGSGDLSLIVEGVQLKDQGDYFCTVENEMNKTASVARLNVYKPATGPTTSLTTSLTTPAPSPTKECTPLWIFGLCLLITAVVFLFIGLFIGWILWRKCLSLNPLPLLSMVVKEFDSRHVEVHSSNEEVCV